MVRPKFPGRSRLLSLGRVLVDIVQHDVLPLSPLAKPRLSYSSPCVAETTPRHLGKSEAVLGSDARCQEEGFSGDARGDAGAPVVPNSLTATPFRAFPSSNCAAFESLDCWQSRGRKYHWAAIHAPWGASFMEQRGPLLVRESRRRRPWQSPFLARSMYQSVKHSFSFTRSLSQS